MKNFPWFGTIVGLIIGSFIVVQAIQYYRFVNAGPRFTAQDGQELCERIAKIEHQLGFIPSPCEYIDKKL